MKKHIMLTLLLAGTTLSSQTTFAMNEQVKNHSTTTTQVSTAQEEKPSLMARLWNKTTLIKNWAKAHKKPLLIGVGIGLAIVAAYLIPSLIHPAVTQVSGDKTFKELLEKANDCAYNQHVHDWEYLRALRGVETCFNKVSAYAIGQNNSQLTELVTAKIAAAKQAWKLFLD